MDNVSQMKRGRGRPPKKKPFNPKFKDPVINNNKENIIPAANIMRTYKQQEADKNYPLLMMCNNPGTWKILFEVIKDNQSYVNLIFDKTGVTITNHCEQDIKALSGKLFPDKMIEYRIDKKITIQLDVNEFYKIMKAIPNTSNFEMFIERHELPDGSLFDSLVIRICENDKNRQEIYSIRIQDINIEEDITDTTKLNKKTFDYDMIVMLNADDFYHDCKNMKIFSDEFEICYANNILTFYQNINNKMIHTNDMEESKSLEFIKRPTNDNSVIKRKFKIDSFFKYTKCAKMSSITKLYLSSNPKLPGIIEFDIDSQFGTLQIFLNSIMQ